MRHNILISILLTMFFSIANIAFADTIHLANGDKISGEITSTEDDEITISTEYAGDITLKWASVVNFESSKIVTVELKDKSRVKGVALPSQPGQLSLRSDQFVNPVTIDVDQVVAVNPPSLDHIPLNGHVSIGGMKQSGNTENQTFHADAELIARGPNNRTTIGVEYNQGASDGKENTNNGRAYLSYDHFITEKWYAYATTDFSRDRFQDLNFRAFAGGGLGYQFWDDSKKYLSFEAGPGYSYEDFNVAEDRDFAAGRWAIDFRYWVIDDRMQFFHDHEGIVNLEDFADVLVRSHTGIHLPVIDNFNFTFQFDVDHDTLPAEGKKKTDFRYIVSVGYLF
jgi:putative salt-induced outer membrane protein YdiY